MEVMAAKKSASRQLNSYENDVEFLFDSEIDIESLDNGRVLKIITPTFCETFLKETVLDDVYRSTNVQINKRSKEEVETWIRNMMMIIREMSPVFGNRDHRMILRLLDQCFISEINDSELVVKLLRMFHSENIGFLDVLIQSSFLGFRPDERILGNESHYLSYVLRHAKTKKETFDGKWFTGNSYEPLIYCVAKGKIEFLSIFLQSGFFTRLGHFQTGYGGTPASFTELCSYSRRLEWWCKEPLHSPVVKAAAVIGTTLKYIFGAPRSGTKPYCCRKRPRSDRYPDLEKVHQALRILFRAIPVPLCRVPIDIVEFSCRVDGRFGELKYGDQLPCSLKQLSRCAVRQRLGENWALPDGIWKLNLSSKMCSYLNLELN